MLVISSRISGCRVTDSITLPKMIPTPIPAPIEPRPAPMPSAIAFSPSSVTPLAAAARTVDIEELLSVTVGGGCLAEVDGGERREDEGLKGRHQADLEEEEGERERQGEPAEGGQPEQHGETPAHEQQQQVTGKDV